MFAQLLVQTKGCFRGFKVIPKASDEQGSRTWNPGNEEQREGWQDEDGRADTPGHKIKSQSSRL